MDAFDGGGTGHVIVGRSKDKVGLAVYHTDGPMFGTLLTAAEARQVAAEICEAADKLDGENEDAPV